jgi:hypothetical protein
MDFRIIKGKTLDSKPFNPLLKKSRLQYLGDVDPHSNTGELIFQVNPTM